VDPEQRIAVGPLVFRLVNVSVGTLICFGRPSPMLTLSLGQRRTDRKLVDERAAVSALSAASASPDYEESFPSFVS